MAATGKRIEFFWDAVSPYTYLASTQIESVAEEAGAELEWRPFLLGAVFKATGNAPPANIPAKGKYLFQDVKNWARHYGVPFRFPDNFPANSMAAQRAALVAADEDCGPDFAKAAMSAYWGEGRDIGDPGVLSEVAAGVGLDPDTVAERIQDQAIKDRLKANTEEAVSRGAFGAPTFFVDDVMFWGSDRLELLRAKLKDGN